MIKKYLTFALFCILISSQANADSVELPVYGNWCGLGYPAEGENPTPIDLVDEACKIHDMKYTHCERLDNRLACEAEADMELVDTLRGDVDKLNRVQLVVANNIGKYFVIQGPVKAISENTKQLFIDRFQGATDLANGASTALLNIGVKLKDISNGLIYVKDVAVDTVKDAISESGRSVELEETR